MKEISKLLTLLLALAMVLTLIPAVARAEEAMPEGGSGSAEIPVRVNPLYEGIYEPALEDMPQIPEPDEYSTQAVSYQTVEQAAATVRTNMKNRVETYNVYVRSTSSDYDALYLELLNGAVMHTGVGNEGDYLMWHLATYGGEVSWIVSDGYYDYTYTLAMTYYTTAEQEAETTTAVNNLISSLGVKNKSDYEKVCAVYDWMCANITYDYDHVNDSSYKLMFSAYAALVNKTAVCQGYAQLFYRLMLELGVDTRFIGGDGGGPHAWNIVQLGDYYYNVDSTWDAGQEEYSWFLKSFWDFPGHEREMTHDTLAFHNQYPIAAESYEPGKTGTKDPYICAGYMGENIDNAMWLMGRDGTLTVRGTGSTYDFNDTDQQPYYKYWVDEITKVVVEDGITDLGDYSFHDFDQLKEVEISATVKRIGNYCFNSCYVLETVSLKEGLEEIGDYGLARAEKVTSLYLPSSLKIIGAGAFQGNYKTVFTNFPENLEILGNVAFYGCGKLEEFTLSASLRSAGSAVFQNSGLKTLTLEDGIETIPAGFLRYCWTLTQVNMPDTLKSIESEAFYGCTGLETIVLPDGLETIGEKAFYQSGLTEIQLPNTVTTLGQYAFFQCEELKNVILSESLEKIDKYTFGYVPLEEIRIPGSVKVIDAYAFEHSDLTAVVFEEGLLRIDHSAFCYCEKLTELNLPDSLEYFGGFYDCTALTSVVIPEGVTEIGDGALANCENLTSVTLPSSVRVIGDRAFSRCYKLESLVIPEGVTEIPQSMVQFCTALSEVVLPSTVTTISTHAFQNCENLTAITLPHGLKSLDYGCFSGSGLTEIIIPASVTSLGAQTFQYCRQLEKAVVHGNVGTSAFEGCSALKQVELKNTVKNLGVWAFKNCTALESITIPGSVTEIQQHCFSNCSGLKEIIFQGDAPQISIMAFETVTATAYYPQDNATWTEDKFQDYKGTLTWVPMAPPCEEHKYTAVITEPTCEAGGYTTYTCSECGHSYVDDYTDPVDHSYEDGHCKWCGKGQAYAKIVSYSTSLGGNIAMNFYVELSDDLAADPDAYIQFTFAGKTVNVPLSEGVLSGTSYRFACPITSKNMTDDITAQVYNANGPVGDAKTMAVDTYCNWIIANTSDQKTINLMKAMLNYGASAQMLFSYRTDDLANAALADADKVFAKVDASAFAHSRVGEEDGIKPVSYTLLLDSETTVRCYFELTGTKTIEEFTFTVDGEEVTPVYKDGYYYIEKANIAAHRLDDMHTFTCGNITITYGGLSYVNQVMTYYTSGTTFDMASALYAYSKAAEAYIG